MASNDLPAILDGKFFTIQSTEGDKVIAKCNNCINHTIAGGLSYTSNFKLHLKVRDRLCC